MNYDNYGEVINGDGTYLETARLLTKGCQVLLGWTDEDGTHLDILFTLNVEKFGTVQRGIQASDLFVSIMGWGSFGFDVENTDTHPGYYAEKFSGLTGEELRTKLAELINGVKKNILSYESRV